MSDGDLNRRNTEAAFQMLREAENLSRMTKVMVDALAQTVASLALRLEAVETELNKNRIAAMGSGPTQHDDHD